MTSINKDRYPWQSRYNSSYFLHNYQRGQQTAPGEQGGLIPFEAVHARPSHITKPLWSPVVKEERFFLCLKKQTVAFFPIESTVCAGAYLFSLFLLFFPQFQSIPDGITALFHGNCLTWAGVSDSRADCQTEQAGVQLTVSANVKWRGVWSRGKNRRSFYFPELL